VAAARRRSVRRRGASCLECRRRRCARTRQPFSRTSAGHQAKAKGHLGEPDVCKQASRATAKPLAAPGKHRLAKRVTRPHGRAANTRPLPVRAQRQRQHATATPWNNVGRAPYACRVGLNAEDIQTQSWPCAGRVRQVALGQLSRQKGCRFGILALDHERTTCVFGEAPWRQHRPDLPVAPEPARSSAATRLRRYDLCRVQWAQRPLLL
jgi:hypothetical protein